MDIFGAIGGLFGMTAGAVVNTTVSAVGGIVMWHVVNWLWVQIKPINIIGDMTSEEAYKLGLKIRENIIKTIPDKALRLKMLDEATISSDKIKNSFIKGLRGE